jgi:hypothetical protein
VPARALAGVPVSYPRCVVGSPNRRRFRGTTPEDPSLRGTNQSAGTPVARLRVLAGETFRLRVLAAMGDLIWRALAT